MAYRYKVISGGPHPHLITCTIFRWMPVFISAPYCDIIINSLAHLRKNRDLAIHAYVIMPTHVHAIVTATLDDLSAIMRDLKKFTSRAIFQQAETEKNEFLTWFFTKAAANDPSSRFKVWQDEFHPKALVTRDMLMQKMEYVHNNPVKKKSVIVPEHWYYSSAGMYSDDPSGPLEVDYLDW